MSALVRVKEGGWGEIVPCILSDIQPDRGSAALNTWLSWSPWSLTSRWQIENGERIRHGYFYGLNMEGAHIPTTPIHWLELTLVRSHLTVSKCWKCSLAMNLGRRGLGLVMETNSRPWCFNAVTFQDRVKRKMQCTEQPLHVCVCACIYIMCVPMYVYRSHLFRFLNILLEKHMPIRVFCFS